MAGYLDNYGVSDARREKWIRRAVLGVLTSAVVGTLLYFTLRDWQQRQAVNAFLDDLRNKNYTAAYQRWGCTDATPCSGYAYPKFLEDWGPESPFANAAQAKLDTTEHCGAGVFARVTVPGKAPANLWIEKSNNVIGFSPWEECPGKKLRIVEFLKSRFGGGASKP